MGCEPGGELFGRTVAEVGEDHLLHYLRLLGDGRGNGGFAMAVQGDPPAADGIDQAAAVVELQHRAFGAADP